MTWYCSYNAINTMNVIQPKLETSTLTAKLLLNHFGQFCKQVDIVFLIKFKTSQPAVIKLKFCYFETFSTLISLSFPLVEPTEY